MNGKTKRIIVVLLAIALLTSLFSACPVIPREIEAPPRHGGPPPVGYEN